MRALCPTCGLHHEVARVLEDHGQRGAPRDVYDVAPLGDCGAAFLTDADLREASARFGEEALVDVDDA
jgi:hypothetical protein